MAHAVFDDESEAFAQQIAAGSKNKIGATRGPRCPLCWGSYDVANRRCLRCARTDRDIAMAMSPGQYQAQHAARVKAFQRLYEEHTDMRELLLEAEHVMRGLADFGLEIPKSLRDYAAALAGLIDTHYRGVPPWDQKENNPAGIVGTPFYVR